MSLIRMFDAAFPPATGYPGAAAAAGYIGGRTPHIWTRAEWDRFAGLYQLPIWTADFSQDPIRSAAAAADAAEALGWIAHHSPAWRAIVVDGEAVIDEPWIRAFGKELQVRGFLCWPYLSLSALAGDPAGFTVWLADWDGFAGLEGGPEVIAHQYRPGVRWGGSLVDLSVVSAAVLPSFGVGPRQ
jgi:hypothetical protein